MFLPFRWLFGVGLMVLAIAQTAAAEEAKKFRYEFDKDDRFIYRTTTETQQTQSVAGMKLETSLKNVDVSIRTLQQVDDSGNFVLQSENKLLKVEMKTAPLGEYTYDSRSPTNEKGSTLGAALTPLYDTMKGAYVQITVTPLGEVVAVSGLSDLLKDVLKDNPLAGQLGMMGTDEAAALTYGDSFVHFAEKAASRGETWEVPFELKLPQVGTFKGKTRYRYEGPGKVGDRTTEKFTETTELTVELDVQSEGATVTGSISSTESSGTAHFDPEIGQIVSKKSEVKMTGNLTVQAGGQNIPVQQEQTIRTTVELLDKIPEGA